MITLGNCVWSTVHGQTVHGDDIRVDLDAIIARTPHSLPIIIKDTSMRTIYTMHAFNGETMFFFHKLLAQSYQRVLNDEGIGSVLVPTTLPAPVIQTLMAMQARRIRRETFIDREEVLPQRR